MRQLNVSAIIFYPIRLTGIQQIIRVGTTVLCFLLCTFLFFLINMTSDIFIENYTSVNTVPMFLG